MFHKSGLSTALIGRVPLCNTDHPRSELHLMAIWKWENEEYEIMVT
jgi:hypothetical protein